MRKSSVPDTDRPYKHIKVWIKYNIMRNSLSWQMTDNLTHQCVNRQSKRTFILYFCIIYDIPRFHHQCENVFLLPTTIVSVSRLCWLEKKHIKTRHRCHVGVLRNVSLWCMTSQLFLRQLWFSWDNWNVKPSRGRKCSRVDCLQSKSPSRIKEKTLRKLKTQEK